MAEQSFAEIMAQLTSLTEKVAELGSAIPAAVLPKVQSPSEVVKASEIPDVQETTLKKNENKEQYRFCKTILNLAQSALSCVGDEEEEEMDDGSAANSTGFLREIRDTVRRRIKLIKLADRSDAGWSMVANYTADNLAENSDDERKIKALGSFVHDRPAAAICGSRTLCHICRTLPIIQLWHVYVQWCNFKFRAGSLQDLEDSPSRPHMALKYGPF